jgi:phage gpG-like protein
MPPDGFIDAKGVQRTAKHMDDVARRAGNVKDASYKVRTVYRKAEERRFQSRGAGSWPALKESTREWKARTNSDPRMMRATNALYKALTSPRAGGQVDERKPDEFRFGTDLPYATFHDRGKGVPLRKLIDLTPAERQEIDDALGDYIARGDTT